MHLVYLVMFSDQTLLHLGLEKMRLDSYNFPINVSSLRVAVRLFTAKGRGLLDPHQGVHVWGISKLRRLRVHRRDIIGQEYHVRWPAGGFDGRPIPQRPRSHEYGYCARVGRTRWVLLIWWVNSHLIISRNLHCYKTQGNYSHHRGVSGFKVYGKFRLKCLIHIIKTVPEIRR